MSVLNVQTAYAKALLIDRAALRDRQLAGDVLGAHAILRDALRNRRPPDSRRKPAKKSDAPPNP